MIGYNAGLSSCPAFPVGKKKNKKKTVDNEITDSTTTNANFF